MLAKEFEIKDNLNEEKLKEAEVCKYDDNSESPKKHSDEELVKIISKIFDFSE